jgi:hypothetical protein
MGAATVLAPNFTGFPNVLTDRLMAAAGPTRWMLISVVVRKTYGWRVPCACISLTTFQQCTGLSRTAVSLRLTQLQECGLLKGTESPKGSVWELNLDCDVDTVVRALEDGPASSGKLPPASSPKLPLDGSDGSAKLPVLVAESYQPLIGIKERSKEKNKNLPPVGGGTETPDAPEAGKAPDAEPAPEPAPDPRHGPIRARIQELQRHVAGVEVWDGRCAGSLGRLLKLRGEAKWPLDRLLECVENRFRSEVNHAESPWNWLARLTEYACGPLDRYGKPMGAGRSAEATVGVLRGAENGRARDFEVDLAMLRRDVLDAGGAVPNPDAWRTVLGKLRGTVDPQSLDTWLAPMKFLAVRADGMAILLAPGPQWGYIAERYGAAVRDALGFDDGCFGGWELWTWDGFAAGNPWAPI